MNFKKNILIIISLVLLVSFTIGCEKETSSGNNKAESQVEKAQREAAEGWANAIIDSAKYRYMDSLFEDERVTSGNVVDLELTVENPATSGTWSIYGDTTKVIIKDVVIGDYICNSINPENEREIECKRNN